MLAWWCEQASQSCQLLCRSFPFLSAVGVDLCLMLSRWLTAALWLILRLSGSDLQWPSVQRPLQRSGWFAAQQLPPPSLPGHTVRHDLSMQTWLDDVLHAGTESLQTLLVLFIVFGWGAAHINEHCGHVLVYPAVSRRAEDVCSRWSAREFCCSKSCRTDGEKGEMSVEKPEVHNSPPWQDAQQNRHAQYFQREPPHRCWLQSCVTLWHFRPLPYFQLRRASPTSFVCACWLLFGKAPAPV